MKKQLVRAGLGVAALTLLAPLLAACGDDEPKLVIYNAQHEQLLKELAPEFTKETGIEVELRNGKDLELSNQLVQEGKASPADVFLTENSPAMSQVEAAGLFSKLPSDILDVIPAQYRPRSGLWTGFVARSTTLVYNTDQVEESDLPASILDLAKPEWKGRISFSPTGADFQAIVAGMLDLEGEQTTKAWLEGIKANGKVYDGNNLVLEAVNSGEVEVGIVYHYYWERDHKESGDVSDHSSQYYFGNQDPGAFVSVSGAGVLASSDMKTEAEKFVEFLVNEKGQQVLADSYALEYPLNPAVQLEGVAKPFDELQPPDVNVSDLDAKKVVDLMTEVGFL
ncbi:MULTISPECIES: iron ABC transporter substrate-binding protein [unclassified Nocardioides]|jgi:iron(III) transport system substrate-binding protein|uniref:iron ABC transporter substrate-binding protein n=1 Tax=unclassified Nocardioides TaxID=2615069 RepID=UPI000703504B|nr:MULTISPECIES: iron ABC transporter substrate-binding protein [unclassified Nocardioides]KRC52724.1 iron ABC transporter substrate-binding protein [Nocardioides sp. Root79]KRC72255.1 iron ABC transporter substrate-binding protein [Nocardioides sp. Root240]